MTETKLGATKSTGEFVPADTGYTTYRKDRNAAGGGILLAIKDDFPSELVDLKDVEDEILWMKISHDKRKNIYAGVFYRQPTTSIDQLESLGKSLDIISDLTKNNPINTILLGGDFNCKDINWENYTVLPGSDQKAANSKLLEVLAENDLSQHQCEPNKLKNILDLFCTNAPGLVKNMSTIPGISGHAIPVGDRAIRAQPNRKAPRHVYQFKKAKWEDIREHLLTICNSFLEQYTSRSIEDNWNEFKGTLLKLMEKYVPSRTTRRRQNLPWWNQHLECLVRWKQRRYNKAKKSSSPTAWAKYRLTQKEMSTTYSSMDWGTATASPSGASLSHSARMKASSTQTARRKLTSWTASSRECSRRRTIHHCWTLPALHTPPSAHWK